MVRHDDYARQMATTLEQWSTQLGELQARAQHAGAEQQAQMAKVLAGLQTQQDAYRAQMKKVGEANEAAFADLQAGSERIAAEFATSYAQAASRFATKPS
jgi:hypothetical protein